jgi:hypothetical protein
MICRNGDCGSPARPYRYALGQRRTALCDACLASLTAMGMVFRLIEEPAAPKPRWLANLTAREDASWRGAA